MEGLSAMTIGDFREITMSISLSADAIIKTDESVVAGNVLRSTTLFRHYLNIAHKLEELLSSDSKSVVRDYENYLLWRLMYEKLSKCHLKLEQFADYGLCTAGRYSEWVETDSKDTLTDIGYYLSNLTLCSDCDYESDVDSLEDLLGRYYDVTEALELLVQKYFPYVRQMFESVDDYYDNLYDSFKEIITNTYYDILDNREDEIKDELDCLIYEREILKDYSKYPQSEHYGLLLKDMLEEAVHGGKTRIIKEKFTHGKALNIEDDAFFRHLNKECSTKAEIDHFLNTFMQIAILHQLTKPKVKMCRRAEQLVPLPDSIEPGINDDLKANKMLRAILAKLSERVGMTNVRAKWSHVKRVMEDEGIIIHVQNENAFGKLMAEICPQIIAENCRKNVNNNPLTLFDNDKGKKYYEWALLNKDRHPCISVAKEFLPLLKLMYPERDLSFLS